MSLLIKDGIIIDPVTGTSENGDLLIKDGKIASRGNNIKESGAETVEASGKVVTPGLVDMHVHLREPGFEAKEDIDTGTRAALKGGFTSVACMPNTSPVVDNASVLNYIYSRARTASGARVYPIGAITRESNGKMLSEMAELKEAGAVALSDDGQPVSDAAVMRKAMQYAAMLGLTIISHCEDKELAGGGVMHEGAVSTALGLKGIPASAEEAMVARDIILAGETGCRLHIAHVSTAGSVRVIREAKSWGISVTAEAAPHHFSLTHEAVRGYNTFTKVNPPLRTDEDVEAVKEGLTDGTIDVIATDHAPHAAEDKDVEYDLAPFGISGLETAVGVVWNELVVPGFLSPESAVAKMTVNPALIMGIEAGTLKNGARADVTIIDPEKEWVVDPGLFASKGKNTPFAGKKLKGAPAFTIVKGVKIDLNH